MDLYEIAAEIAPPEGRVRIRFGKVVSVQTRTVTVTVAGSTDTVAGVRYSARMAPEPGTVVILLTDGADLFALDHLAAADLTLSPRTSRSTDQSLTNDTDTAVIFSTVDSDAWGCWSAGSPTRITVPVTGRYQAAGVVRFAASSTGSRQGWLRLNGSTTIARVNGPAAVIDTVLNVASPPVSLTAGDYLELWVRQNSGGALALTYVSAFEPSLGLVYLGP